MVPIMNASAMRREGRKNFCPEDTPAEYFKRVGRTPSTYAFKCFCDGWYSEEEEYEKSIARNEEIEMAENAKIKKLECSHDWRDLNSMTTHRQNDRTFYCMAGHKWCSKCGALAIQHQKLPYELSTTQIEQPQRLVGMTEVLKEAIKILEANADLNADLVFQNDQGSEHREFEYGTYCGRTAFANQLYLMLTE